jgi:hypothetical protein
MNTTALDWITSLPGYSPTHSYQQFQILGAEWNYSSNSFGAFNDSPYLFHHQKIDGRTTMLRVEHTADVYTWESSLVLEESKWYVRAKGQADTLEAAATAALAWKHDTVEHGGLTWFKGAQNGLDHWETRPPDQIVTVQHTESGLWAWNRNVDLSALKALGIDLWSNGPSGEAETAEAAMLAILDVPAVLRHACRQVITASHKT